MYFHSQNDFCQCNMFKGLSKTNIIKAQGSLSDEQYKKNKDIIKIVHLTKLQVDKVLCKKAILRINIKKNNKKTY